MPTNVDPDDLRNELTNALKTRIKKAVGNRCEFENKKFLPRYLHAHHIIPIASRGPNIQSNMIVLCCFCHADAHANKGKGINGRTKLSLKGKIKKRPKELQKKINKILGARVLSGIDDTGLYRAHREVEKYLARTDRDVENITNKMMKNPPIFR